MHFYSIFLSFPFQGVQVVFTVTIFHIIFHIIFDSLLFVSLPNTWKWAKNGPKMATVNNPIVICFFRKFVSYDLNNSSCNVNCSPWLLLNFEIFSMSISSDCRHNLPPGGQLYCFVRWAARTWILLQVKTRTMVGLSLHCSTLNVKLWAIQYLLRKSGPQNRV